MIKFLPLLSTDSPSVSKKYSINECDNDFKSAV